LSATGLISKLSAAKIVESGISELRFTNEFCAYLAQYNQGNLRIKAATVEGWRDIMLDFDPNLKSLSDEEISMTIVLLDYFLQKASVK
jgi:hypothetical protein